MSKQIKEKYPPRTKRSPDRHESKREPACPARSLRYPNPACTLGWQSMWQTWQATDCWLISHRIGIWQWAPSSWNSTLQLVSMRKPFLPHTTLWFVILILKDLSLERAFTVHWLFTALCHRNITPSLPHVFPAAAGWRQAPHGFFFFKFSKGIFIVT